MTTKPTDREHELAADLIDQMESMGPAMRYRTLAQALADQRAKYETVADELAKHTVEPEDDGQRGFIRGLDAAALCIRQVSA